MNIRRLFVVSTASASLSFAGLAGAQQEKPRVIEKQPVNVQVQPGQPGQPARQHHMQNTDQKLATCMAIANQEEVAIAKFVEDKVKNKDVKEFAEMLVKDHESFLKKLAQFAPEATAEGYLNSDQQQQQQPRAATAKPQVNVQAGPVNVQAGAPAGNVQQTAGTQEADGHHLDFVELHREIAVLCIQTAKEEMGKKDEKEIDKCYIGHQIAKHGEMKTKLTVFERHTTGELKQVISEGLATTEKHLKQAEKIMKKLDSKDTSVTSRDN